MITNNRTHINKFQWSSKPFSIYRKYVLYLTGNDMNSCTSRQRSCKWIRKVDCDKTNSKEAQNKLQKTNSQIFSYAKTNFFNKHPTISALLASTLNLVTKTLLHNENKRECTLSHNMLQRKSNVIKPLNACLFLTSSHSGTWIWTTIGLKT